MEKNKFISLFHRLEKAEVTAFGKYLRTAKSKNKVALLVFAKAKKAHPEMAAPAALDWDKLALGTFPSAGGDLLKAKKLLSNTFHDLYLWLREFLMLQKAHDKSLESEVLWLGILQEKGMKRGYKKSLQKLRSQVFEKKKTSTTDYLHQLLADYFQYEKDTKVTRENLPVISRSLDTFYHLYRHKLDCEILNWEKQGQPVELGPAREGPPLLLLYKSVRGLILYRSEKDYHRIFAELQRLSSELDKDERIHIWQYLKVFCAQEIRKGEVQYLTAVHELDRYALANGFFIGKDGLLTPGHFLNIVSAAGAVKELSWASDFVRDYLPLVAEERRYEIKLVADSILLFHEGRFREALAKLEKFADKKSPYMQVEIRRRAFVLKCKYELRESEDELLREITNFTRFLQRDTSPHRKAVSATLNFLTIFRQLLSPNRTKEELLEIWETAGPTHMQDWLLEKIRAYRPFS